MKITEEVKIIPGAPLEGLNPLPKFRSRKPNIPKTDVCFPEHLKKGLGFHTKVLPYLVQDRYSRKRLPLRLKFIVLENEYLKAEFLPEYGGRLYSLYDKVNGEDLVMKNVAIQPANLAIRNAWLSGGIEWNIGSIGHTFTTCDNVFCAKLTDEEGNDFLRIYEFERLKNVFWQVDFHLSDGSKHLTAHVKIINPFDTDTTTYWWSNTAVTDTGKTRILASGENIISFVGGDMRYEHLPKISAMPGVDVSYPSNATRSFDFFIQPNSDDECTWEAAAFGSGLTMYERSTPPLSCKKLFCWGNHHAGKHWQEFLSDDGHGYYAEIQAGIAPSQLHDRILKAKEVLEWTQCFGSVKGDAYRLHCEDYYVARDYLAGLIDERISAYDITALDEKLKKLADLRVSEKDIIHLASGFGALEAIRMKIDGDGEVPKSMCFPTFTIQEAEYPWKFLLENGVLPSEDARYFVPTYNVSERWLSHIKASLKKEGGESWYSYMQYGVAVYDGVDNTKFAADAFSDEDNDRRCSLAEKLWLKSISIKPTALVYRNLACLEQQRGNCEMAEKYYDLAMDCEGSCDDFALSAEYLGYLSSQKKYEKLWKIFCSLPPNCQSVDRVRIYAAAAAVKLDMFDYLEGFFSEEHWDIREGENSLTDIWFEYCARCMAKERGIASLDAETLSKLIDEAWDICKPDPKIDFRMSVDKKQKYRVQ